MLEINEVIQAIDEKLNELIPAAVDQIVQPRFEQLFTIKANKTQTYRNEAMHSLGRMKQFGTGTAIMEDQAFEGGKVEITPVALGKKRSWSRSIAERLAAEGHDLENAVQDWVTSYGASRDVQAAQTVLGTATGYDGKALFATDHPLRSKFNTGGTLSNTDATAAALDADALDTLLTRHEETIAFSEAGDPIDNVATHLVTVNRADFTQAKVILQSERKAGVATNDINPERNALIPVLWRRLNSGATLYYYLVSAQKGLLFIERMGFTKQVWYNEDNLSVCASASYEGGAGWDNWRAITRKARA